MGNYRTEFFNDVYRLNKWDSAESVSGCGSTLAQTRELAAEMPAALLQLDIRTMLDIPCGDFNWMSGIDLSRVDYMGGDIVPDLVASNVARHSNAHRQFRVMDMVLDDLPKVDLVFVRDCFIHFTNALTISALNNIVRSGSKYLCATSDEAVQRYPNQCNIDLDRAVEGVNFEFRPMNLMLPPFSLPQPLMVLKDGPGWDGRKSMTLWDIRDIAAALALH